MMSMKCLCFLVALSGFALPATGCGGGHSAGVAEGVDEPPPPLSKEEEAVERANARKMKGG
jgi:hypothetical protein